MSLLTGEKSWILVCLCSGSVSRLIAGLFFPCGKKLTIEILRQTRNLTSSNPNQTSFFLLLLSEICCIDCNIQCISSSFPDGRRTRTLTRSQQKGRWGWRLVVGGGADRACSTFPSDRTEGIKTVSNIASARREGELASRAYACSALPPSDLRRSQPLSLSPPPLPSTPPAVTTVPGSALTC